MVTREERKKKEEGSKREIHERRKGRRKGIRRSVEKRRNKHKAEKMIERG